MARQIIFFAGAFLGIASALMQPPRRVRPNLQRCFYAHDDSPTARVYVAGVAISLNGLYAFLETSSGYFPVQVTDDTSATNSPAALLLLQLLAGIDMATPLFPPELLSQLVVSYVMQGGSATCEVAKHIRMSILEQEQHQLQDDVDESMDDYNDNWSLTSDIQLPICSLDEVTYDGSTWKWSVRVHEAQKSLVVVVADNDDNTLEHLYAPNTAAAVSIALALRYRAPIRMTQTLSSSLVLTTLQVHQQFPMFRSSSDLLGQSNNVSEMVQHAYQLTRLQAALRVAKQKGDGKAEQSIRKQIETLSLKQETSDDAFQ
jgi:hypothetical protein